jgi:hypothetical protein
MTVMQLLVSFCGILLAVVGFGGRFLFMQLISGQKEMNATLVKFVKEVSDYHAKNDLEIQKLNYNLASFKKECEWTHNTGRRRVDANT